MSGQLVSNRQARFQYEILETFEAGIVLVGTDVKSLRQNHGSLVEAYVAPKGHELFLLNAHIPHYAFGNIMNHAEKRPRKLLMHRHEMRKLVQRVAEKGLTLVPLDFHLKNGRIKLLFGLGRGKRLHDKRASIREREDTRALQRALKDHRGTS
jgi:SsrA-binding protein